MCRYSDIQHAMLIYEKTFMGNMLVIKAYVELNLVDWKWFVSFSVIIWHEKRAKLKKGNDEVSGDQSKISFNSSFDLH